MPLIDLCTPVKRDKFEFEEDAFDFYFPCCVCKHRHGRDIDEPCITCDHNMMAKPEDDA